MRDFEYHESKCSFPTFQESNNKAEELKINQDKLDEEFAKRLQEYVELIKFLNI